MHPAYSVIFFTTASGAGYGLLVWLALFGSGGLGAGERVFALAALGLALVLITAGLLSSTAHLGRPTRAWRALSQWRTSWLSREGVAALATYPAALALGFGWIMGNPPPLWLPVAGLLAIVGALATVWSTGMIYQSLPTIRAWCHPLTTTVYLVLALATGAVLFTALQIGFGREAGGIGWVAALLLAVAWMLKGAYWSGIDEAKLTLTAESATGLGRFGKVRPLEPPHTQPNYVMREMGYQVARKHAERLRLYAVLLAFLVPLVALLLLRFAPSGLAAPLAVAAAVSMATGIVVERWLFFAEARHVSMLYYGVEKA